MEWENPEFMGYLLGGLPRIRKTQEDKDVAGELIKLERVISTYDLFLSQKEQYGLVKKYAFTGFACAYGSSRC